MGNKGHEPKLDPVDDDSSSGLHELLDLLDTDSADSSLLDDQTFEVPARLRFDAAARCIASCLPPLDPMQNAPSCVVHSVLSCASCTILCCAGSPQFILPLLHHALLVLYPETHVMSL